VPRGRLLSGTVTFLFTDIEGSTELLKRLGRDQYEVVLAEHAELLRASVAAHDGRVVDTQGDSMFCVFPSARDAVSAAIEAQRALGGHTWPEQVAVRVRMGLHSSEPKASDERYVGIGVHRAARIGSAAHGGQILMSETARALVADDLPGLVSIRDLGVHRLKDIDEPVRLHQVLASELQERFPAPRTVRPRLSGRARLVLAAAALVAAGGGTAAVLLTTSSASAKPVRLVANSIAVLDPTSGRPVGSIPLGFAPTSVAARGDQVWVLNWRGRTAVAIDPHTLRVVQTVGIDGDPDAQYAADDKEWVTVPGGVDEIDNDGGTITRLWPRARAPAADNNPNNGLVCTPSIAGAGRRVWVSEGRHVAVIDASSGNVLHKSTFPPVPGAADGVGCYTLMSTPGRLFAVRFPDLSFGPVDPDAGTYTPVASNIGDIFGSSSWAAGFGVFWLANAKSDIDTSATPGVVSRFNLTTGNLLSKTQLPSAGSVTTDPATGVWQIESLNGKIANLDPRNGQVRRTFLIHHVGSAVGVGHGRVWVGLGSP
jgi:class 3 adenylate cyclase